MKVAFPVEQDRGLDSEIHGHFGSAPGFVVVDTVSMSVGYVPNSNSGHAHGMCTPLSSFEGRMPDAVVAAGMGAGALGKLRGGGVEVYLSSIGTVRAAVEELRSGRLLPADPASACGMHGGGHGSGCGHHD
jgi:predicted Fe-Mo cluster-binding NifX family protein